MDKSDMRFLFNWSFTLVVACVCWVIIAEHQSEAYWKANIETFKMYHNIRFDNEAFGLNGIYYSGEYYCVWVEDRLPPAIDTTETHEACHHLVYTETEHFCGE